MQSIVVVNPIFRSEWKSIEFFLVETPFRHELINKGYEAVIVGGFEEVEHFVDDDVF